MTRTHKNPHRKNPNRTDRRLDRRAFLAAASASVVSLSANAQSGPIRLIFPFAAGGGGDALARVIADALTRTLGETVVVESRTGAGGQIGVQAVRTAQPDGNTLLITPVAPITIHPIVYPNLPYDPFRDLTPLSQVATFDFCLAVGAASPAKTLGELVEWIKQDKTRGAFGSPGAGTLPHFFGLMFGKAVGLDLAHVAYRGSALAMNDLIGGQVPIVVTTVSDVAEFAKAGTVRVLAVSGQQRSPFLPDVATFRELGIAITGDAWYAMYTGANVPKPRSDALSAAIVKVLQDKALRDRILQLSLVPTGTTGPELAAIQKADFEHWGPIVRASGFKPN